MLVHVVYGNVLLSAHAALCCCLQLHYSVDKNTAALVDTPHRGDVCIHAWTPHNQLNSSTTLAPPMDIVLSVEHFLCEVSPTITAYHQGIHWNIEFTNKSPTPIHSPTLRTITPAVSKALMNRT